MKECVVKILEKVLGGKLKKEEIENLVEVPPQQDMGDFAFPCFVLAKIEKKSPLLIAQELVEKIRKELPARKGVPSVGDSSNLNTITGKISGVELKSAYVNFFVDKKFLAEKVLKEATKKGYGSIKKGSGMSAFIEHTSINPNASPHMGRSRNALIGDFLVRLLKFQGFKTETHYFVNDVGKQIAMLVLGAEGEKDVKFSDLLSLYVKINEKVKENPELEKKVFELLNKFESGDKSVKKKFNDIVNICIKGQSKILEELDIKYDFFDYESKYLLDKSTDKIMDRLKKTGKIFKDDEGRLVLNQEGYNIPTKSPVLVLTRADGTSLYPLRDIAYTIEKIEKNSKNNFLVLGEDQKTYFQQISAVMDLLGYPAPKLISYSFVLLTDGKMSTRQGNVVLLEDFFKDATNVALSGLVSRGGKKDLKKAKLIAMSAVKYSLLKIDSMKNVVFDLESALSFEGNTGPYLLYSYARASSIIRKIKKSKAKIEIFDLSKEESALLTKIGNFPDVVKQAYNQLAPNLIANYAFELAQTFNEFYHAHQVIGSKEEAFRLKLIEAFRNVLKSSLNLLGIEELEEM